MFPKLLKMAFAQLRQELLIIQAPKFGLDKNMVVNVIFGH